VLFREFVAQFFASETATSDQHVRQAIIGVVAFLITPGLLIPIQLSGAFEFAAVRFPAMLDPLIRLLATIFITYGIVSMGVIAAFTWDSLGFDRRDAMVLGPLPVGGATIIGAKLAALAALLLAGAATVNITTAVSFALIASNHTGGSALARHFGAHLVATMTAATFVFCLLVTIRALIGMVAAGRTAMTSILQFALVSTSLSFIVLAPTALHVLPGRRGAARVEMQSIPEWSPSNWFLGVYEVIRGTGSGEFEAAAVRGTVVTILVAAAAVLATIASYHRQMQLALTPAPSAGLQPAARAQLVVTRWIAGRDPIARTVAEFVVATGMRNRPQQVPVAINAAIGVAVIAASLSRAGGEIAALTHPRTVVLWIPMVFGYWLTIGIRAAFFVPSELPASWTFHANAPANSAAYWVGTRAAMRILIIPPAFLLTAGVIAPLLGARIAAWHAAFVVLMLAALIELVALTIDSVPFTSPYRPGHAKLKSRWPLYLLGMFAFAYWPVRAELSALGGSEVPMLAWPAAAAVTFHLAGRRRARRWSVEADADVSEDAAILRLLVVDG
jgi:hypothetical protein